MIYGRNQGGLAILFSIVLALALTVVPLPDGLRLFRPEWSALVVIYWCMAVPNRFSVGKGWIVGLLLDVLQGSLLGQHALAMAIIAYVTANLHQRLRLFPLWQQGLTVLMLLSLYQLLLLWFDGIIGLQPKVWTYWLPPVIGMLFWPWTFLILRKLRRSYSVN